jgi:branched-chain amino acid aminotransferase
MLYAYVNGRILPAKKASVSIFDRGLVLGDGLFETLRAVDSVPEFFKAHYARLKRSAYRLRITVPLGEKELGRTVAKLCQKSKLKDAAVRITLTRGHYSGVLSINKSLKPSLFISLFPVSGMHKSLYNRGVKLAISSIRQTAAAGIDATVKTTNYLANILAKAEAETQNCFEAILLQNNNEIAELSTSSFFCVRKNTVITPPVATGILPGITRGEILKILSRTAIPYQEKSIFLKDIPDMTEVFLTSSIRGLVPVIKISGRKIGNGKVGPVFKELRALYLEICDKSRKRYFRILKSKD